MVVDVGWRGSVQKSLTTLIGAAPADIFGCYLGLFPDALNPSLGLHNATGYPDMGFPEFRDRVERFRRLVGLS
jgi:hypothetical protein